MVPKEIAPAVFPSAVWSVPRVKRPCPPLPELKIERARGEPPSPYPPGVVVPMPTFLFELTIRPFPAIVRSEEKRLVELAVPAKLVVEVALVVVLLSPVKLTRVEEALETKPLLKYQERFVVSVVLAV